MNPCIAIITTDYLYDYVQDIVSSSDMEVEYRICRYSSFKELPSLCNQLPSHAKGIIATNAFSYQIIRRLLPGEGWVINAIGNDHGEVWRTLLQLLYQNRDIDFSRVYADILDATGLTVMDYVFGKDLAPLDELTCQRLQNLTLEELMAKETEYYQKHQRLWTEGHIDLSITRFSHTLLALREEGVPVHFPYFARAHLLEVCRETLQEITLQQLRANQVAIILVTPKQHYHTAVDKKAESAELYQALKKFAGAHQLDCVLQPCGNGYEIITNREAVEKLTDHFQVSAVQEYVQSRLSFPVSVGYGLGLEMHAARMHALDANREADRLPQPSSSLVNEKNELIGPLKTGRKLTVSRQASDAMRTAARKTGLSLLSLQKMAAIASETQGALVTSQEVAYRLTVTKRTANRILSALLQAGLAEIAELRQGTTKGRPERVYRLLLD